jgi:hypothetical protein
MQQWPTQDLPTAAVVQRVSPYASGQPFMGGTGSDTSFWRDCESAPDQSDAAKTKEMKKLRKKLAALKQQVAGSKINLEVTTTQRLYRPLFCCLMPSYPHCRLLRRNKQRL